MSRILALLALAPVACAAWGVVSLDDKVWAKADGSYAGPGDYERAEAACRSGEPRPDAGGAGAATREFVRCMRDQGWTPVDRP